MEMPVRELLTVDEAARILGCTPIAVRKMLQRGALTGRKAGPRLWLVDETEVKERVEQAGVGRKRGGYKPEPKRG
jgi:excisionase family DNA binding protein